MVRDSRVITRSARSFYSAAIVVSSLALRSELQHKLRAL
jgi:hypothetical protein